MPEIDDQGLRIGLRKIRESHQVKRLYLTSTDKAMYGAEKRGLGVRKCDACNVKSEMGSGISLFRFHSSLVSRRLR